MLKISLICVELFQFQHVRPMSIMFDPCPLVQGKSKAVSWARGTSNARTSLRSTRSFIDWRRWAVGNDLSNRMRFHMIFTRFHKMSHDFTWFHKMSQDICHLIAWDFTWISHAKWIQRGWLSLTLFCKILLTRANQFVSRNIDFVRISGMWKPWLGCA